MQCNIHKILERKILNDWVVVSLWKVGTLFSEEKLSEPREKLELNFQNYNSTLITEVIYNMDAIINSIVK